MVFSTVTSGFNVQYGSDTTQNESPIVDNGFNTNQHIRPIRQRFYQFLISFHQLIKNEFIRSMIDRIIDRFTMNNDSRANGIISQTHIPTTHIAIYKTDHLENNSLVYPGDYLNYTIEIKNIDQTDITTNIVVNDYLPIEVEYVGSSSSDVNYNSEDHFTYIVYNSLNSNETRSFTITVQVSNESQIPTMITNTAKVTTQDGFSNETSVRTAIGPYTFTPLLIEKDDGTENGWVTHPENPMVFINYSITVRNQHPLDVHNIIIVDKLPDQVIFESASHDAINENTNVYWHFDSLQANSSITLWVNVSLNQSVEPGSYVENKVFVTSAETGSDQGEDTVITAIWEGNPPSTKLSIGSPNYEKNKTIFVTSDTPITLSAKDNETYWNGVTNITYEIYNEDQLVEKIIVEDNSDSDKDPRKGFVNVTFTLENECTNLIRYHASDRFNNEEINEQVFQVINTPPTLNLSIDEPIIPCYHEIDGVCYPVISPNTEISIETACTHTCEEYVDLNFLTIEIYHGQNHGSWELVETLTIYDNDEKDIDNNNDIIKVKIHLEESCWYQIHYWSEDKLGNRNPDQGHVISTELFVDAQPPLSSYWFTGPQYHDSFHWITNETILHVESTDDGCNNQGVGVHQTEWWLRKKQDDNSWQETHRETIFDNDENDLDDTIGSTYITIQVNDDGQHEIFYRSTDLLLNTQASQKRQVHVDSQHPSSTISVGQPNCSYIEDDELIFCVRTDTPIQINTIDLPSDCAVGIDYFEYEIYRNNNLLFSERVYGITQVSFTFEDECSHTVRYRAVDLLGNKEPWNNQVFKVDDKKPSITLTVHDPSVNMDHNNPHYYVRTNTSIEIDGKNHGSCPHWNMSYRINNADWHDVDTDNLPHTFSFPDECQYTLEIQASDCIGNTDQLVKRIYVDDTPPTFRVIKPHNGIFEPGETFHVTIFAKDESVFPPPCYQNHAVGIPDQSNGEAWIIDIYPDFKICQLEIDYLYYQENSFEYNGYVTIPSDCSIPDGSAYFVGGAFDALNNGKHVVKNIIEEYYDKYGPDSYQFTTLIAELKQDEHIVEIVMDSDPPSGQDSEPPIVKIVQPGQDETIDEDTISIIINATDDVTETKNLTVRVEIMVPGYRHFLKTANYDEVTGNFSVSFDNSCIKNNTEIRLQAYATDSDDKTGISLPVFYTVKNMVYFSVWLNNGWNLVDFGSIQGNRSVPNVFQSVEHEYDIIFELSTELYYIKGQSFTTLEEIAPGQKYWVKVNEAIGFYLDQIPE